LKNENFVDPLEDNSKNLIESNKEISIPDHENQNHADKSTSLSQEIKNKRYHAFWEEERKRNNYAKSLERFETLHSQSELKDWEEFLDHYLIDGVDLAKLMIEHSVGVQVKEVIKVSKIDQDFFSDDES